MAGRSGAVLEGAWHPVLLWATILTLSQDEVSRLNREAKEKAAPVAADATADAKKAAVDEYFKHWDNKAAKDETEEDRKVSQQLLPQSHCLRVQHND